MEKFVNFMSLKYAGKAGKGCCAIVSEILVAVSFDINIRV